VRGDKSRQNRCQGQSEAAPGGRKWFTGQTIAKNR